jgi:anti-anti-sigma regulatory factor
MDLQSSTSSLEVEPREDVIIARFTRPVSLCGQAAEAAAEHLESLMTKPGQQRLLVDLGNVQTLTSFMIGKLVTLNRMALAAERGRLALFNMTPNVREVLEISRLNLLMSLCEDESAALRGS